MSVDALAGELLRIAFTAEPTDASLLGFPGFDDELADHSEAAEEAIARRWDEVAVAAAELEGRGLSETEHQTLEFVRHVAAVDGATARLGQVEWTVTDLWIAPAAKLISELPRLALDTAERVESYRNRLSQIPHYLETAVARHRQGVAAGRTPVARLVRAAVAQLDRVLADPALAGITRDGTETLVNETVRPALDCYRLAIGELVPFARDDEHPGLAYLPEGEAIYAALAARHGAGRATPAELHRLGLELTAKLVEEYAEVGRRAFGVSDRATIFERLRHDPALRWSNGEEMLGQARAAVRRAEAAAPGFFRSVPETACLVEPVPQAEAAGAPPAYYYPPALDGSRVGTFFVNTSSPTERFRHVSEVVAFHEAVPGHHFQLALAQQEGDLPPARRLMHDTAAAEGWGLYSERLADEMGLYTDDLSRLGMLTADSWRAGRLVVDTGLHALGWSRERAVSWLAEHTPLAGVEIESEVDRYIAMPGQALSYMVGRIELQALRTLAEQRLGEAFELGAFHDLVLRAGPLPLPVLRGAVERWTTRRERPSTTVTLVQDPPGRQG